MSPHNKCLQEKTNAIYIAYSYNHYFKAMRLITPDSLSVSTLESCSTLGKLIVAVRKAHGQSQLDLCAHANVGRTTLSEIERGSPRVQFAHWLAVLDSLGLLEGLVNGASAAAGTQLADMASPPRMRRT